MICCYPYLYLCSVRIPVKEFPAIVRCDLPEEPEPEIEYIFKCPGPFSYDHSGVKQYPKRSWKRKCKYRKQYMFNKFSHVGNHSVARY